MPDRTDPSRATATLLGQAGLTVPDDDLETIAASWPDLRARTDRLWFPETRDAEPAAVFRAAPDEDD